MSKERFNREEDVLTKVRLLVNGVNVKASVSELKDHYKPKIEAVYTHHMTKKPQRWRLPQEIILSNDGSVVVWIRYNKESPWNIRNEEGQVILSGVGVEQKVGLVKKPRFYDTQLSDGTETWRVVQLLGVDLIGVMPSNFCVYFSRGKQCVFCELVPTYQREREYAKSRKSLDKIREAIDLAFREDGDIIKHLVVTTGNLDWENQETVEI